MYLESRSAWGIWLGVRRQLELSQTVIGGYAEWLSEHPVRVTPRTPSEPDPLPDADALLAAPLTFNSLCKWAAGISDTLALGILNESLGLPAPVTAAPCIKKALRAHPAYQPGAARLEEAGVSVLDPDDHVSRGPDGLAVLDWPSVVSSVTR